MAGYQVLKALSWSDPLKLWIISPLEKDRSMDIQDLGAIGEFVSSIAIVISLVFLALEMRASRKATQRADLHNRQRREAEIFGAMADNPDFGRIIVKVQRHRMEEQVWAAGEKEPAKTMGILPEEEFQLFWHYNRVFRFYREEFEQMDPVEFKRRYSQALTGWVSEGTAGELFWEGYREGMRRVAPDFVAHVERLRPKSADR